MEEDGVHYDKIRGSKLFMDFVEHLAPQLQYVKLEGITENEKKAFFISILHIYTHEFIFNYLPESHLMLLIRLKTSHLNYNKILGGSR